MAIQSSKVARVGMILAVALALGAPAMRAQSSQEQNGEAFQRSFPMNAGGTLVVENRKGTIHVTGSDTDRVVVSVHKIFLGGSDKDRQEWMAETKVSFDSVPNHLNVRVDYPEWSCVFCVNLSDEVDLTIAVPRATNIEFDGNRPDMAISSIDGDIRISSNRSPIAIKSTNGAIRIETNRGDVKLLDVAIKGRLDITSNRADAVIEAKSLTGNADLETERGSIVVRMPSTVGLNLDYQGGRRASFHCDFPVTTNENGAELNDVRGRVDRDGVRISGAVNQGGARMMLRTTRGSISLEKSS
jgi:Putative adhesin